MKSEDVYVGINGLICICIIFSIKIIEVILEVGVKWGRGWYNFYVLEKY